MITDPLTCDCGALYFPRPDGIAKCRTCLARDKAAAQAEDEFDDNTERKPAYLPTIEEIEQAKAEIRAEWTPRDWRQAIRGNRREN